MSGWPKFASAYKSPSRPAATIGRNIHAQRSEQKLPLHKLAKLTGVSEQLLDHYELGKNEIGLDELLKIACALELEIEELITAY